MSLVTLTWLQSGLICGALIFLPHLRGQQLNGGISNGGGSGGSGGNGITVYSGTAITFTGTQFLPIGGGSTITTTEATAQGAVPAIKVSNFYAQASANIAAMTSIVFTWRDGGSSQTLTCTIAAGSKACSDTTNSFTTTAGDLIDVQTVTTGVPGVISLVLTAEIGGPAGGTVTSVATACGISGGPITSTGTVSRVPTLNVQSGASYAILTGDCGKTVQLTNAGAVALSIAAAGSAGFATNWFTDVLCSGAAGCTLTPTTSTINGNSSQALTQNQSMRIISDGANYQGLFLGGSGGGGSVTFAQPYVTDGSHFFFPAFQITKPLDTNWINQNGATRTATNGSVYIQLPTTGGVTDNISCRVLTNASSTYTITVGMIGSFVTATSGSSMWVTAGDSGSGKLLLNGSTVFGANNPTLGTLIGHAANATSNITSVLNENTVLGYGPVWYRIQDDATNAIYSVSRDGINFIQLFTELDTAFLPVQPANIVGFCAENVGQAQSIPFGLTVFHLSLTSP